MNEDNDPHFDMGSQPQPGDADDQKQREEHAYELAEYIRKYPAPNHSLRARVKVLSHVGEDELDRLLPAVEQWLELFEMQKNHNS